MLLYQAPLEGITGYIYRRALFEIFGGIDKYFAPFISPYDKRIISNKEKNQLCIDHNSGYKLVPQILSMDCKGTIELMKWLNENYGYNEFNLNFGCPSSTVVSKKRGAGALEDLERLNEYLDSLFAISQFRISIKTRLGLHNVDEFEKIIDIYNQYSLEELIIHPRIKDEMYKGYPHMDIYRWAEANSRNKLVYNANIFNYNDYLDLEKTLNSSTQAVMIGRGMISNPGIFREIKGGEKLSKDELKRFLNIILSDYSKEFSGEIPVLHKMKEIWTYLGSYLSDYRGVNEKVIKKILKSNTISQYKAYEREILSYIE